MGVRNNLKLSQVVIRKRGTGDGKNIILQVFDQGGRAYELSVPGNLKEVVHQAVTPGLEIVTFPDAATRAAARPAYAGQIALQLDIGSLFYGTDVVVGAWTAITGTSVLSVFGRAGAVTAQAGDYSENQISNLRWRPPVDDLVDLPLVGNTTNDIRLVVNTGELYRWNGVAWVLALNITGMLEFQGTWDADSNTPALADGVGTKGHYYVVNVEGSTSLDGIDNWQVGDWVIFNGTAWQQIDNSEVPGPVYVFRPGGTPGLNVYDDWSLLVAAAASAQGEVTVVMDDSAAGISIPVGAWQFSGPTRIVGGINSDDHVVVTFEDGASLLGVTSFERHLALVSNSNTPVVRLGGVSGKSNVAVSLIDRVTVNSTGFSPFFSVHGDEIEISLLEGSQFIGSDPSIDIEAGGAIAVDIAVYDNCLLPADAVSGTTGAVTIRFSAGATYLRGSQSTYSGTMLEVPMGERVTILERGLQEEALTGNVDALEVFKQTVMISTTGDVNLRGVVAIPGAEFTIYNRGPDLVIIKDQDVNPDPGDNFDTGLGGDWTIPPLQAATVFYDDVDTINRVKA